MQQVKAQNISSNSGGATGQSLLLDSGARASLVRPTVPGSIYGGGIWAISFWAKRARLDGAQQDVISFGGQADYPGGAINGALITFNGDNTLSVINDNRIDTTFHYRLGPSSALRQFRDEGAWTHFVINFDSNDGYDEGQPIKFYINGEIQQDLTSTGTVSRAQATWFLGGHRTSIGNSAEGSWDYQNKGYLAEFHAVEGLAPGPEHFALEDASGAYNPIPYEGEYGNNGFYLPFKQGEDSGIGTDHSGNNNNFDVYGLTSESVVADCPVNNFATLNPLGRWPNSQGESITWAIEKGNLRWRNPANAYWSISTNFPVSSGKWYAEFTYTAQGVAGISLIVGVADPASITAQSHLPGTASTGYSYGYGNVYENGGAAIVASGLGYMATAGETMSVTIDMDDRRLAFYAGGNKQWEGDIDGNGVLESAVFIMGDRGETIDCNFGQRPWLFEPPKGFKAICTNNLPEVSIKPKEHMDTRLWLGSSSTTTVDDLEFDPGLVWIKPRDYADNHNLFDSIRGGTHALFSNLTDPEGDATGGPDELTFLPNGFSVRGDSNSLNRNGIQFVSWNFKAGGPAVTNNDGSVPSQVSANKDMGFSVVSWNGNSTNGASIGHGLGAMPSLIIYKNLDDVFNWYVHSTELSSTAHVLTLNSTDAQAAPGGWTGFDWNSTTIAFPSTDYFGAFNLFGNSYVAYCFANTEMLQVGSYTGNGSADGTFVALPFKPAFVLIKAIDGTKHWNIYDNGREEFNARSKVLYPNLSESEYTWTQGDIDFLSNGFRLINGSNDEINGSLRYLYLAIAEEPFKIARGN